MPPRRKKSPAGDALHLLLPLLLKLPVPWRIAFIGVAAIAFVVWLASRPHPSDLPVGPEPDVSSASHAGLSATPITAPDGSGRYLLCFWNVENLFDDQDDNRRPTDEEYDNPFASDSQLRRLKYDRIASALMRMNGGNGPDIIAGVEFESPRAAELLRATLNAKIAEPKYLYTNVEVKSLDAGRHITPVLITRLPVDRIRTRLQGSRLRILETHLRVNGYDLRIVVSHWTSQLTQRGNVDSPESGRGKYAFTISEWYKEQLETDPHADILVCGDFNDSPESDAVVQILQATGNRPGIGSAQLFNLMAMKSPQQYGTVWYGGKPLIYDQICVSPGLLDGYGWGCDTNSAQTVTDGLIRSGATRRQPWRFGNPKPSVSDEQRGYSDHFPVTVELTVLPPLLP